MKKITKLTDKYVYRDSNGKVWLHDIYSPDENDIIEKVNELVDAVNKLNCKRPAKKQHAKWVKKSR